MKITTRKRSLTLSCLLTIVSMCISGHAQNRSNSLATAQTYDVLTIEKQYREGKENIENTLGALAKASKRAWATGDSLQIIDADVLYGTLLVDAQRLPEAGEVVEHVLPVVSRHANDKVYSQTLNTLGFIHINLAHYDVALRHLLKSLSLQTDTDDDTTLGVTLRHLGLVFYKLKNYDKAVNHYHRAIAIQHELADSSGISHLCMDLSLCYAQQERYADAALSIDRGLKACGGACTREVKYAAAFARGTLALQQHRDAEAKQDFEQANALATDKADLRAQAESAIMLATLALNAGDKETARVWQEKAEQQALASHQNLLLTDTYAVLTRFYKDTGDYERTTYYQKKFTDYRDSVFDERIAANLAEAQATFEDEQNKLAIALKDELIRQQRIQGMFFAAGVLALAAVAIILFKRMRRRRALKRILEQRVAERVALLEKSVQRWQEERRKLDTALITRASNMSKGLDEIRKECRVILTEDVDADTRECINRMIGVIEEMDETLAQGLKHAIAE